VNTRLAIPAVLLVAALVSRAQSNFTTTNFFNWETQPVHPVALSPDHTKLVVCNLPDDRLEIFDVTSGVPLPLGSVPVGLDPVTVRFRTATEIWVANYISDSISIVDLPTMRVVIGANLTNTICTSSVFEESNFGMANMSHANCNSCDFFSAVLTNANLTFANCASADFTSANLRNAITNGASFLNATFSNTIMPDGSIRNF
jgi:uncharacterized protein YjbI with pentapeptide repeats